MNYNDIVVNGMYANDAFSKWLGISIAELTAGECVLTMSIRHEMTNGFGIAHGGITYSLADSALAFASNSLGNHAVSIETSISHTKSIKVGDILTAKTTELSRSNKIAIYQIIVTNQVGDRVALFKGTVFIKDTMWSTAGQQNINT